MKTFFYVAFYMCVLVIVGSFIGQGYGMQMTQYTPGRTCKMSPVVKQTLEIYQAIVAWFS